MYLINHGGRCCGIKTIFGFDYYSTTTVSCLPLNGTQDSWPTGNKTHSTSDHSYPGKNFFGGVAPAESGAARLDRLLAYVDKYRPKHCVEVVLCNQQSVIWNKVLEKRGFKLVTTFKNSNSGSTVHIYHRVTPLEKKKEGDAIPYEDVIG